MGSTLLQVLVFTEDDHGMYLLIQVGMSVLNIPLKPIVPGNICDVS